MANDFATIQVKRPTQIQLKLLAAAYQQGMNDLAAQIVDVEWREAVKNGLVTDRQLENILARIAENEAQG